MASFETALSRNLSNRPFRRCRRQTAALWCGHALSQFHRPREKASFFPAIPRERGADPGGRIGIWLAGRIPEKKRLGALHRHRCRVPADIRGDINQWRALGLQEGSFDALIAFEVVEHGDFYDSFFDLLRPGGLLLLTTPVPAADWFLMILERMGLNQPRTSPHSHLHDIRRIDRFEPVTVRRIAGLSQWGVFRKPDGGSIDREQSPA